MYGISIFQIDPQNTTCNLIQYFNEEGTDRNKILKGKKEIKIESEV
jgi:hypothetical protein